MRVRECHANPRLRRAERGEKGLQRPHFLVVTLVVVLFVFVLVLVRVPALFRVVAPVAIRALVLVCGRRCQAGEWRLQ